MPGSRAVVRYVEYSHTHYSFQVKFFSEKRIEERKNERKKERKKESKMMNKIKIFSRAFSNAIKVSGSYTVDLAIE